MPSVDSKPLTPNFDLLNQSNESKFNDFLKRAAADSTKWKYIKFRCMIQDLFDQEFYSAQRDSQLFDRTTFYCVNVPGENEWISSVSGDPNDLNQIQTQTQGGDDMAPDHLTVSLVEKSYPLASPKNKSCMLKVYDMKLADAFRINDIVEVCGLIEPLEGIPPTENAQDNVATSQSFGFEPSSDFSDRLVPRIHAKTIRKLAHIDPLVPERIGRNLVDTSRLKLARTRLSNILTQLLAGDSLTVDYLIALLISRIHSRADSTKSLGQISIGLIGFKPEMRFVVEKLYSIISRITTHSHYIDLSIENLNNLRLTPKRDHENSKLLAGALQLPDGIFLLLNETALTEGHLNSQGVSNIGTLSHILKWQKHKYDYQYHSVEIDTDFKILVVSEGKSLLPVQTVVKVAKNDTETIASMRDACEAVDGFLDNNLLNDFRYFITTLMAAPEYVLPDSLQQSIAEDYSKWRQDANAQMTVLPTPDDLSNRLTLARYLTLSHGETTLKQEFWQRACDMETERLARLATESH